MRRILCLLALYFTLALPAEAFRPPDEQLTPGALCTAADPDFERVDYPERIARCKRGVGLSEKRRVAALYGGIPESEWSRYEFDHLIPLCAGGANAIANLWPEPIEQARDKDRLENRICRAMKAGELTQAAAVRKVREYFEGRGEEL